MVNASPLPMIEWMILLLFLWPDTNIAGVFLDRIDERNGSGSQRTIFDKIWSRYCYCLFGWFSLGVVSVSSSMPLFALYTCCGGGVDCWSLIIDHWSVISDQCAVRLHLLQPTTFSVCTPYVIRKSRVPVAGTWCNFATCNLQGHIEEQSEKQHIRTCVRGSRFIP